MIGSVMSGSPCRQDNSKQTKITVGDDEYYRCEKGAPLTNVLPDGKSFFIEFDGLRIIFAGKSFTIDEPTRLKDKASRFLVTYAPKSDAQSVTAKECASPFAYTMTVTLHSATQSGEASAMTAKDENGNDLSRKLSFNVKCYKSSNSCDGTCLTTPCATSKGGTGTCDTGYYCCQS